MRAPPTGRKTATGYDEGDPGAHPADRPADARPEAFAEAEPGRSQLTVF